MWKGEQISGGRFLGDGDMMIIPCIEERAIHFLKK